ncbi:MAG: hypothetical protein HC916_08170 [Coleofasciculaceae cyanobacterium SM2_1_6]|nr:hypothetical protein [Coleofasciculaceae cyanobacterium SM2_1_6]
MDGNLEISEYIEEKELDKKDIKKIKRKWSEKEENTRADLAMMLARLLGVSIIAMSLIGIAAFNPNADKAFLKDLLPQLITPQVTLMVVALSYYFREKKEE